MVVVGWVVEEGRVGDVEEGGCEGEVEGVGGCRVEVVRA